VPAKGLAEELPPLSAHEALVEANRCLYCYDAPCAHACPTHIDIPRFIKKIATDNLRGSARTILEANLLGATCARVCPVQELCEGACVMGKDHQPIMIGRLQRYAMDHAPEGVLKAAAPTGRRVAVVGSGPAGLSCAGELALRGHAVTVFEKRDLSGGLSTYGIIALREPIEASLAEVRMIERLGVRLETGVAITDLDEIRGRFDAVFLSVGLGRTPALGIPGEEHILDGLAYIEQSKLDPAGMTIGEQVAVIGAGNTAIDCATVARRLGAKRVTLVYRRGEADMRAYPHEIDFIRKEGVEFRFHAQPTRVLLENGQVTGLACGEVIIPAGQIVKAIGQEKPQSFGLALERGFIAVNSDFETSTPGVFAGGDCIRARNVASTVMAVQDGKLAAQSIHRRLTNG
jgi:dihydropyrimidine dehydrogenase (NAD+) subunit PreT